MKRILIIFLVLFLLSIFDFTKLEAVTQRNQYEDTVGEAMWDWATTLGKSPKEKKTIKSKRRVQRAKKRAEKKSRIEKARLEKENLRREAEAEKARQARINARRREIEKNRNLENPDQD